MVGNFNTMIQEKVSQWAKTILAGISISIGCVVYLKVGGLAGAVLFSFGLLTVVHFRWLLYTGKAGFFDCKHDKRFLLMVLVGNIIGCLLSALLMKYANPDIAETAAGIFAARMAKGPLACFCLAIGCGFIMTVAVKFGAKGQYLPLLFGVPAFIMCGFTHSIADAFYFLMQPWENIWQWGALWLYLAEVLGNLVGCNLYRLFDPMAQND